MIVMTVFEPNGISIWFKNRHHDYIPFTVKGNGSIVFSVYHGPGPEPLVHHGNMVPRGCRGKPLCRGVCASQMSDDKNYNIAHPNRKIYTDCPEILTPLGIIGHI